MSTFVRTCPFCKSKIHFDAKVCAHCTSRLPEPAKSEAMVVVIQGVVGMVFVLYLVKIFFFK